MGGAVIVRSIKLKFQKGDTIAITLVATLAILTALFFLPKQGNTPAYAEIYQNGKLIQTLPLNQPQEITVTGKYSNTVTVRDSAIAVTHSDCPGADCVRTGWSSHSGRSIVCLPNGLEIRIVSRSDVDFVVG